MARHDRYSVSNRTDGCWLLSAFQHIIIERTTACRRVRANRYCFSDRPGGGGAAERVEGSQAADGGIAQAADGGIAQDADDGIAQAADDGIAQDADAG